jgi:hypothetical protein
VLERKLAPENTGGASALLVRRLLPAAVRIEHVLPLFQRKQLE